jgi:hypothetical protein
MIYVLGAILKETHDTAEVVSDFFEAWVDVPWQSLSTPDPQTLKDHRNAGIPQTRGQLKTHPAQGVWTGTSSLPYLR